jgi:hypothetical protein
MGTVSDWLDQVEAIAQTAGAAVSPKYTDVKIGAPYPRGRCARIWWGGEVIPAPQMGEMRYSLSTEIVGHAVVVTVFEPMGDVSEDASKSLMGTMADFISELRDGIDADRTLGGKSVSIEPEATPNEFIQIGNALFAFASMVCPVGNIEYDVNGGVR